MTPEEKQQFEDLKNKVESLETKLRDLTNPATISEELLETLVRKGFIRYDGIKILTYTNPSGKDFYSIFAKYGIENTVIAIEDQSNFMRIESINTSTDTITITGHGLSDGQNAYVATTNQVPGGLSPQIFYYIISATTNTFKLSLSSGGAAVDITSVGAGNNYILPQ